MISDFPILGEIKDEYRRCRATGSDRNTAVQALMHSYANEIEDNDDCQLFWIGLADAQLAFKELSSEVSERALTALSAVENSDICEFFGRRSIAKRKDAYLQAPMPERKNISLPRTFQCAWNIGDVFAYKVTGEAAESININEKYILLHKVDDCEFCGKKHPIVTLRFWDQPDFPKNAEEFYSVTPLKLISGRQFTPEYLFEYRAQILFSNKKQVEDLNLQYLGNYSNTELLENEILAPVSVYYMLLPKEFSKECCVAYRNDWMYSTGELLDLKL